MDLDKPDTAEVCTFLGGAMVWLAVIAIVIMLAGCGVHGKIGPWSISLEGTAPSPLPSADSAVEPAPRT